MIEQLNTCNLPEAPASLNFTASVNGFAVQFTLRSEDELNLLDRFTRLAEILEAEYGVNAPSKPGELAFNAEKLVPNVSDGTVYWKVKGGNFQKWGVTVWPEVLQKAGLNPEELDPINGLDLDGWVAVYIVDPEKGHPKKVVELRPPASAKERLPVYPGMGRRAFFSAVEKELGLDSAYAGQILLDTGKYAGGFAANAHRVAEMWQDLLAAAPVVVA